MSGAAGDETAPRETELKLDLDPSDADRFRALPILGAPSRTSELRARYYDTAASDLQQAGLTLRVRDDGERRVQTVKGPAEGGAGLFDRPEWETVVAGDGPDLDAAAATPLGPVLARQGIRGDLAVRFSTRVTRTTWRLSRGDARIAVTLDEGVVEGAPGSQGICEVELELEAGSLPALFALAREMATAVPLSLGVRGKAERGYALGTVPTRYVAEPVRLHRGMSAADALRAIVHACLRHYRLNEAVVVATRSAEALHQSRVALRRLRSALSLFRSILGPEREIVAASLRPLSERLGRARNLDVFLERVAHPEHDESPHEPGLAALLGEIETRRAAAYDDVGEMLASPEWRLATLDLVAAIECGDWRVVASDAASEPVRRFARDLFADRTRKLRRRGRHLAEFSGPQRHRIRVAAKKLRYASEFMAELYGPKRRRRLSRFVKALSGLQEVLGHLNDIETAHALAAELAQPRAAAFQVGDLEPFAAGILAGRQIERRDELIADADRAHRRFRKAETFWE